MLKAATLVTLILLTVSFTGLPVQFFGCVHAAGQTWIVISVHDSGVGTLRWCLANAVWGDIVSFNSLVFPPTSPATITVTSELPHIVQENLTIDAAGAGVILSGGLLPPDTVGLTVDSKNNTITGLQILGFSAEGIRLTANADACNISGNVLVDNSGGITANHSRNHVISGNNITGNHGQGVRLIASSGSLVSRNRLVNNWDGVRLESSSGNTVSYNVISHNADGIFLNSSLGNVISDNHIEHSMGAVHCIASSQNTISRNTIQNSEGGVDLYDYSNDNIVWGNTVSGNWAGVSLINSSRNRITANNVTENIEDGVGFNAFCHYNIIHGNIIANNTGDGIEIFNSSNNTISKNKIAANRDDGIELSYSSNNNVILGNTVEENVEEGIWLYGVSNNMLQGNNISSNYRGIIVEGTSTSNTICGNVIEENSNGFVLRQSSNSVIHHNNIMNNINQTVIETSISSWDDGLEGNYWSDYVGMDPDHDGIGEPPWTLGDNNTDRYPLMGIFYRFNASLGQYVNVISNSTLSGFEYSGSTGTITMYVSNSSTPQSIGFCRVGIPKDLMAQVTLVTINDGLIEVLHFNNSAYANETHTWTYFAYPHSTHEVEIIPEIPAMLILPLVMITTLSAVFACRRKRISEVN